jgi:hypothetical protein
MVWGLSGFQDGDDICHLPSNWEVSAADRAVVQFGQVGQTLMSQMFQVEGRPDQQQSNYLPYQ